MDAFAASSPTNVRLELELNLFQAQKNESSRLVTVRSRLNRAQSGVEKSGRESERFACCVIQL